MLDRRDLLDHLKLLDVLQACLSLFSESNHHYASEEAWREAANYDTT